MTLVDSQRLFPPPPPVSVLYASEGQHSGVRVMGLGRQGNLKHRVCHWQVDNTVTLSISDALSCTQVWSVSTSASVTLTEVAEFDHEGEVSYSSEPDPPGPVVAVPLDYSCTFRL